MATNSSGVSVAAMRTLSGKAAGNMSSRSSTQVILQGKWASARTMAAPTWPAPNKVRWARGARQGSTSQRRPSLPCATWVPRSRANVSGACAPVPAIKLPAASNRAEAGSPSSAVKRQLSCWRRSRKATSNAFRLASTYSKARWTTPPQHCPRLGPSAKRSSRAWVSPVASMVLAISTARNSRWPPPMVST
ncbi:hypothetical protein D3C81_1545220 [compost metagenome]